MGNDQIDDYVAIEGIDGSYLAVNVSSNMDPDDFVSANQCIIDLVIDGSGSMDIYEQTMEKCLQDLKNTLCNSNQQNEIQISATIFNNTVGDGKYNPPRFLDTSYKAYGCTALYDAIVKRYDSLLKYIDECRIKGANVSAFMVILSDGFDNVSRASKFEASQKIKDLFKKEVQVAFVAFGTAAFGIAESLGIPKDPKDPNDPNNPQKKYILEVQDSVDNLKQVMRLISQSAISASRNATGNNVAGFFDVN